MFGVMQACLWLSIGAPDKTPLRRRADSQLRNGSACRLEAARDAACKPLLLRSTR